MIFVSAAVLDKTKTLIKENDRDLKEESEDRVGKYRLWLLKDKKTIEIERIVKGKWKVVGAYNGIVAKKNPRKRNREKI